MIRTDRNPMKFEGFNLFSIFTALNNLPIHGQESLSKFRESVENQIKDSISNPAFINGQITESMFEHLVRSLGCCKLIKKEDSGVIHGCDNTIKIPDFRLVLNDGNEFLVEVKNHYKGFQPFKIQSKYLEKLLCYSNLMNRELKFAIFWSEANLWVLVSPSIFDKEEYKYVLPIDKALKKNEMRILGDLMIGLFTSFLTLKIGADKNKPRLIKKNGGADFTIGSVEFFSERGKIEKIDEKTIAEYLILYGNWEEKLKVNTSGELLESIEFTYTPNKEELERNDHIFPTAFLSCMFSKFFKNMTKEGEKLKTLNLDIIPDYLNLIPKNYQSDVLPLKKMILSPNDE